MALFILLFFDPLAALLSRRNMRINWGKDNSIVISDLSSEVDKDLATIFEKIDAMEESLHKLQTKSETGAFRKAFLIDYKLGPTEKKEASVPEWAKTLERIPDNLEPWSTAESRKHAEQRVRDALSDPKWV